VRVPVEASFIRIPLADGRTLSAHLWRPAGGPLVPAILEVRPYRGFDLFRPLEEPYFSVWASHGYAVLAVDIAGSGQSDGIVADEYLPSEIDDAIAAIGWCAAQDWCDGKVGMGGMSWSAFTALRVSTRRPAALKALVLGGVSEDGWRTDIHNLGGALYAARVDWAATMLMLNALPPDPLEFGEGWKDQWLARLAANRPWIEPWLTHPARDAYWAGKAFDLEGPADLPLLLYAGWADKYATSVLRIAAAWRGPIRTLIGPWEHSLPDMARRRPRIDFLGEALRWWDYWLKEAETGVLDDPPLRVWIGEPDDQGLTAAGRWAASSWPVPEPRALSLAVVGDGRLGAAEGRPPHAATWSLQSSPRTPGALAVDRYEDEPGPFDLDAAARAGAVLAVTDPMTEDVETCGQPVLRCRVVSDKPGGLMVARLVDIAPDSRVVRMTTGALNLTFRDGFEHPSAPVPDQPMEIAVDLQATAWRLKHGHRLGLVLSADGWPTLWPDRSGARLEVATDSVTLSLPLVDQADAREPPIFADPRKIAHAEVEALKWIDADHEPLLPTGLTNAAAYDSRSAAHHLPATGTDYLSASRFELALADDARQGAAAKVARMAFQRPDWSIRVDTRLVVTSTENEFEIDWTIRAEHDGAVVLDITEGTLVPRTAV
jgi:putative CocE/NonD family hydrolase